MSYTIHTIGPSHPLYKQKLDTISWFKGHKQTAMQCVVYEGQFPIAHFFGKDAKPNASAFVNSLERNRIFGKVG